MSKLKIKISDIQHLTDARYFSAKNVSYLGFNRLTTSSNDVKLIQEWVFGPQIVSEFIGNDCISDIQSLLDEHQTEVVHFDYFIDMNTVSQFSEYEIFMDIILDIEDMDKIQRKMEIFSSVVDYFVIKSTENYTHIAKKLELIKDFPLFLDIKFDNAELTEIITFKPEGIVLRGGEEERVGVKSFDQLDEIFDILAYSMEIN